MRVPSWKSLSPLKKTLVVVISLFCLILVFGLGLWIKGIPIIIPSSKVSYQCEPGKTALRSLLVNHAAKIQEAASGVTVVEIDGVSQSNGRVWQYQVDHQQATIGAQVYVCQGKEQIRWELK